MTFINYASREINCKVVYYGPGHCGKVENLQFIYDKANPSARGRLISLPTETDHTLYFDFLPLELGNVRGFKTRFHLYSVPGQVFYDASRKLILKGVDGVVFVADSERERMPANLESLRNLKQNLLDQGYDLRSIPYVLQLNKRDSSTAVPFEEMVASLRVGDEPVLEAIAHSEEGIGVFDTLKAVAKLVLQDLVTSEPAFGVFTPGPTHLTLFRPGPPIAEASARSDPPRERPAITFNPDAPASFEIRFEPRHAFPAEDLFALILFPAAFLVGSSLFLAPGAAQHLLVNVSYCLAGVAGALWIHHRNERDRIADP